MGPITATLGLLCGAAALFTLIGRDRRSDADDGLAVIGLVYVWSVGAMANLVGSEFFPTASPPFAMFFGPPVDVALALYVFHLNRRRPALWKRVVFMIAAFQLMTHIAFGLGDKSAASLYAYKLALNVSFVSQLACVSAPGGWIGLRSLVVRLSRGLRRHSSRHHEA